MYRYVHELGPEFAERLRQTPMENHCKSVVHTYSGFIWRVPPKRSFGALEGNRAATALNVNADKEGGSLNEVMKGVQIWASVFGCVWVVMDKPAVRGAKCCQATSHFVAAARGGSGRRAKRRCWLARTEALRFTDGLLASQAGQAAFDAAGCLLDLLYWFSSFTET